MRMKAYTAYKTVEEKNHKFEQNNIKLLLNAYVVVLMQL